MEKKIKTESKDTREYLNYTTLKDADKAMALLFDKFYGNRLAKPFGSK